MQPHSLLKLDELWAIPVGLSRPLGLNNRKPQKYNNPWDVLLGVPVEFPGAEARRICSGSRSSFAEDFVILPAPSLQIHGFPFHCLIKSSPLPTKKQKEMILKVK